MTLPLRCPLAVGTNDTWMAHAVLGNTTAPAHALVALKSPETATELIGIAPAAIFVTIIVCGALDVPTACGPNDSEETERPTTGVAAIASSTSVRSTPPDESLAVSVGPNRPSAVGLKVTLTSQWVPIAWLAGQLLV